jgi:hypothetical protein
MKVCDTQNVKVKFPQRLLSKQQRNVVVGSLDIQICTFVEEADALETPYLEIKIGGESFMVTELAPFGGSPSRKKCQIISFGKTVKDVLGKI